MTSKVPAATIFSDKSVFKRSQTYHKSTREANNPRLLLRIQEKQTRISHFRPQKPAQNSRESYKKTLSFYETKAMNIEYPLYSYKDSRIRTLHCSVSKSITVLVKSSNVITSTNNLQAPPTTLVSVAPPPLPPPLPPRRHAKFRRLLQRSSLFQENAARRRAAARLGRRRPCGACRSPSAFWPLPIGRSSFPGKTAPAFDESVADEVLRVVGPFAGGAV